MANAASMTSTARTPPARASVLFLAAFALAMASGCNRKARDSNGADASPPFSGAGAGASSSLAVDGGTRALVPKAPAGAAAAASSRTASLDGGAKTLDARSCNPGVSLDPADKGKSIQSDTFRYTLLDLRSDVGDATSVSGKKVYLLKLQIENASSRPEVTPSITEVSLSRDKADPDRSKERDLFYRNDFLYPRTKICVDLASDVKPGMLTPGEKAIGYYVFQAPESPPAKSLWFSVRNVGPDKAQDASFLKVAASFRLK